MMEPIEKIIQAVEEKGDLTDNERYNVVMYLEMLRDLMIDTSYYYARYAADNLPGKRTK